MIVSFLSETETFNGYFAAGPTPGPAVILLPDTAGLFGHIIEVADRLSSVGLAVFVPEVPVDDQDARRSFSGAINFLLDRPEVSTLKTGIIGFGRGGELALQIASRSSKIGLCINYYGVFPEMRLNVADLHCPVIGFFAEHDLVASQDVVDDFAKQLERKGKPFVFETYPGTQPGFFDDGDAFYDAYASADSWKKTIYFLDRFLDVKA